MFLRFPLQSAAIAAVLTLCAGLLMTTESFAHTPGDEAAKHNFNSSGPILESMKDGAEFVDKMEKEIAKLNDYSLVFETKTFKKDKTVVERGNLYFKKPKQMRIEEIGDYNKGSVAVIGKDGKARAHSGGITSFVTVTTNPDDKMLDAANGDKMEDSDFASLARILQEKLKSGHKARVSEKAVEVEGVGELAYVLEVYHPSNPKNVLKRIYVHPGTNLPIRWDDYDYKDPCLSTWKNVKPNTGLSDDLFKL